MAVEEWYVNDDGDDSPGYGTTDRTDPAQSDNWSNAFQAIGTASPSVADSDIVYVGYDHIESQSSDFDLPGTLKPGGCRTVRINWDGNGNGSQGDYDPATTGSSNINFQTTSGNFELRYLSAISAYGFSYDSDEDIKIQLANDETSYFQDCVFNIGDGGDNYNLGGKIHFKDCSFDSDDTSNTANVLLIHGGGDFVFESCDFSSTIKTYRTALLGSGGGFGGGATAYFIGCDLSGFSNTLTLVAGAMEVFFVGCKYPTFQISVTGDYDDYIHIIDCDFIGQYDLYTDGGECVTDNNNLRKGGKTTSWEVETGALTTEAFPFKTPWITFYSGSGSKTFDIYTATNTTRLDTNTCFMEVEALDGSAAPYITERSSTRDILFIDGAASNHTAGGTWISGTYQDYIRSSVTVQNAGYFRARLCFTETSRTDTVYVDRTVVVT